MGCPLLGDFTVHAKVMTQSCTDMHYKPVGLSNKGVMPYFGFKLIGQGQLLLNLKVIIFVTYFYFIKAFTNY